MVGNKLIALMGAGVLVVTAVAVYLYRQDYNAAPSVEQKLATGDTSASTPEQQKPQGETKAAPPTSMAVPSFDVVRIEPSGEGVIAGRAEPGWQVSVESGDTKVAEATADAQGQWSAVLDKPLPPGDHALSLKAISPDGTRGLTSQQPVVAAVGKAPSEETVVALSEPSKPTQPLQDQQSEAHPAQAGTDNQTALAEAAEPAEQAEIAPPVTGSIASEATTPEQQTASASTAPSVDAQSALTDDAKAEETTSTPSAAPSEQPQASQAAPQSSENAESSSAPRTRDMQKLQVAEDAGAPAAEQQPPADAGTAEEPAAQDEQPQAAPTRPKPPVVFKTVDYDDTGPESGKMSLAGTTDPGSRVILYFDNDPLGQVLADSGGKWTFQIEKKLESGQHVFRAERIDEGTGIVIGRAVIGIERMKPAPDAAAKEAAPQAAPSSPAATPEAKPTPSETTPAPQPTPQVAAAEVGKQAAGAVQPVHRKRHRPKVYIVRRGDTLWEIAESYFGGGWQYRAIVHDNRHQIHNPNRIYPSRSSICLLIERTSISAKGERVRTPQLDIHPPG
jgi:nucleoid-associated protein YgaU